MRVNLLLLTCVLAAVAVLTAAGATVIGVTALDHVKEEQVEQKEHFVATQNEQNASAKAGLKSRILTIGQRCHFTEHVGRHFPLDHEFTSEAAECKEQLKEVRGLLEKAP